ncbi:hypothetical protein ISN44_As12g001340 [Arabidopsis suecica]|uniref:Uncharacterized protein n=1 Tax=Arabidopsis suecica TaxID=45249 RepID=A0A8T1YEN0_ARASU|nr:hypothetical protein ISN44_As12g001340 [Arabidopsis suecica]
MDEKETHVGEIRERERERKRSIRRRQERDGGPRRKETLLGEVSDKNSLHARWPTCSVPTTVARVPLDSYSSLLSHPLQFKRVCLYAPMSVSCLDE